MSIFNRIIILLTNSLKRTNFKADGRSVHDHSDCLSADSYFSDTPKLFTIPPIQCLICHDNCVTSITTTTTKTTTITTITTLVAEARKQATGGFFVPLSARLSTSLDCNKRVSVTAPNNEKNTDSNIKTTASQRRSKLGL